MYNIVVIAISCRHVDGAPARASPASLVCRYAIHSVFDTFLSVTDQCNVCSKE